MRRTALLESSACGIQPEVFSASIRPPLVVVKYARTRVPLCVWPSAAGQSLAAV